MCLRTHRHFLSPFGPSIHSSNPFLWLLFKERMAQPHGERKGDSCIGFYIPKAWAGGEGKTYRSFEHRYGESIIAQESKKVLDFGKKRMAGK